jgi:hypothetical protein
LQNAECGWRGGERCDVAFFGRGERKFLRRASLSPVEPREHVARVSATTKKRRALLRPPPCHTKEQPSRLRTRACSRDSR